MTGPEGISIGRGAMAIAQRRAACVVRRWVAGLYDLSAIRRKSMKTRYSPYPAQTCSSSAPTQWLLWQRLLLLGVLGKLLFWFDHFLSQRGVGLPAESLFASICSCGGVCVLAGAGAETST